MNTDNNPINNICVFCGSSAGNSPEYKDAAIKLANALAERKMTLVYGGGNPGLMGIISRTVLENGGKVIGVMPRFMVAKNLAQEGLSELILVDTMAERKERMIEISDAFISLPGGLGTLDEIFEVLSLAQLGLHGKPSALYNVNHYYDQLNAFLDTSIREGFVKERLHQMIYTGKNPEDIISFIERYNPPDSKLLAASIKG